MSEQARETHQEPVRTLSSPWASVIEKRYRDAYSLAQTYVHQGEAIKVLGALIGVVLVFVTLLLTGEIRSLMLPGFVVAAL